MALGLNTSEAPDWANKWSEKIKKIIDGLFSVKTYIVPALTDLPDPKIWGGRQIWCQNIGASAQRLLISDGTNWRRTDTGAIV